MPSVVWMAVIFSFSSRQRVAVSDEYAINFIFFKTLHLIEYAVLFVLNYRALRLLTVKNNVPVKAFLLTVGFAATDEWHQNFVPTREGAVRDVIIDAVGAILIWLAIKHIYPVLTKKPSALVRRFFAPLPEIKKRP